MSLYFYTQVVGAVGSEYFSSVLLIPYPIPHHNSQDEFVRLIETEIGGDVKNTNTINEFDSKENFTACTSRYVQRTNKRTTYYVIELTHSVHSNIVLKFQINDDKNPD